MLSIVIDSEFESYKDMANMLKKIAKKVEKGSTGGFDPTFNVEGEEEEYEDSGEYDEDGVLQDDLDFENDFDDEDDY